MQWVLVHGHIREKQLFLRNTLWSETLSGTGIQLTQRCHIATPTTSTQKHNCLAHLACFEGKLRKQTEMCFIRNIISLWPEQRLQRWLHAPHAQTPATHAWNKQLETNARNEMRRHAMQRQIPPRKTAVGQLRFGNKIENPFRPATRAWIITILGALWTTTLICLANHGTRIGGWILIADTDVTNGQKSNLQREIHLGQTQRRTYMNSHTEQR